MWTWRLTGTKREHIAAGKEVNAPRQEACANRMLIEAADIRFGETGAKGDDDAATQSRARWPGSRRARFYRSSTNSERRSRNLLIGRHRTRGGLAQADRARQTVSHPAFGGMVLVTAASDRRTTARRTHGSPDRDAGRHQRQRRHFRRLGAQSDGP